MWGTITLKNDYWFFSGEPVHPAMKERIAMGGHPGTGKHKYFFLMEITDNRVWFCKTFAKNKIVQRRMPKIYLLISLFTQIWK